MCVTVIVLTAIFLLVPTHGRKFLRGREVKSIFKVGWDFFAKIWWKWPKIANFWLFSLPTLQKLHFAFTFPSTTNFSHFSLQPAFTRLKLAEAHWVVSIWYLTRKEATKGNSHRLRQRPPNLDTKNSLFSRLKHFPISWGMDIPLFCNI